MAEVIVTGGQGFLGSNLVRRLVQEEREVCATYNYTLPSENKRTRHLSSFRCDVTHFEDCGKLIMQENPVILFHLVAQPIVTSAKVNPKLTFDLTTMGTWNILEAARLYGRRIRAIVFVSSDKVYGSNVDANELSPLAGVDHPYNASKVAADAVAQSYARAYDLPIVTSRSANLYGPSDFHWDRIVPGTCRDLVRGKHTVIRSDGRQLRDYIYVEDGVGALVSMADAMETGKIPKGSIFNFGSEQMYSVLDVVRKLQEIAGRQDLEPEIMGQARDEIDAQHIDYSLARQVLGWEPKIDLAHGLEKTFNWYWEWLGGYS